MLCIKKIGEIDTCCQNIGNNVLKRILIRICHCIGRVYIWPAFLRRNQNNEEETQMSCIFIDLIDTLKMILMTSLKFRIFPLELTFFSILYYKYLGTKLGLSLVKITDFAKTFISRPFGFSSGSHLRKLCYEHFYYITFLLRFFTVTFN